MRQINNWEPEVRSLLKSLATAGCKLVSGNNGEEDFAYNGNDPEFIRNLTACDEAWINVTTPETTKPGHTRQLYLVFGNSPGELVSDYNVDPAIESACEEHNTKWEGRKQPTKPDPYQKPIPRHISCNNGDRVDGYDRDNTGESPDC